MGVKARLYLQLPYAIQLKQEKDYVYQFHFENFRDFEVKFYFNDDSNEELYNRNYGNNFCANIRIIATYNLLNSEQYEKTKAVEKNDEEYAIILPAEDKELLLNEINQALDKLFRSLRATTGMFWAEDIKIAADSYLNNNILRYFFYSPNRRLVDNICETIQHELFYASIQDVHQMDDSTFEHFEANTVSISYLDKFLNKAKISIYQKDFYNFVIYICISAESFIQEYIGQIEPSNDIVYNKLTSNNYDYLDLYYNVLLKYLKGRSLSEIYQTGYTYLKRAYKLRNSIMHRGKLDQEALQKAGIAKLDVAECERILEAFERSKAEIENL